MKKEVTSDESNTIFIRIFLFLIIAATKDSLTILESSQTLKILRFIFTIQRVVLIVYFNNNVIISVSESSVT